MIVAILGVFTAQILTVLLSVCLMVLSVAVLALLLGTIGDQQAGRSQPLALQPSDATACMGDRSMRSLIAHHSAAPSRAPPTLFLQQRRIDSPGNRSRE